MLARKHYAQKRNSRGPMKTSSVSGSSTIAINNKLRKVADCKASKKMTDYNSSKYINQVKIATLQCNNDGKEGLNTRDTYCGCGSGNSGRTTNNIHKELTINTQSSYIEKRLACNFNIDNEPRLFNNISC